MKDKTVDIKEKKNTPLFVTSIIMLISSIFEIFLWITVILSLALLFILYQDAHKDIANLNFYIVTLGIFLVFALAVITVAFYASICGIKQKSLIKCKKLALFIVAVNVVTVAADIIISIYLDGSMDVPEIIGLIYNLIFYILVPLLYFIFADKVIKKSKPTSKYDSIIDSI